MAGAARWHLLPLHGELPAAEQSKVFAPPPRGQRKALNPNPNPNPNPSPNPKPVCTGVPIMSIC